MNLVHVVSAVCMSDTGTTQPEENSYTVYNLQEVKTEEVSDDGHSRTSAGKIPNHPHDRLANYTGHRQAI